MDDMDDKPYMYESMAEEHIEDINKKVSKLKKKYNLTVEESENLKEMLMYIFDDGSRKYREGITKKLFLKNPRFVEDDSLSSISVVEKIYLQLYKHGTADIVKEKIAIFKTKIQNHGGSNTESSKKKKRTGDKRTKHKRHNTNKTRRRRQRRRQTGR